MNFITSNIFVEKKEIIHYNELLDHFGVTYKAVDYSLLVDSIANQTGWILHISIVISQLQNALELIIPRIISHGVCFKIPKDKETAKNILDGYLGYAKIGKVITIYPGTDDDAVSIYTSLLPLCKDLRGPKITTDTHLGGNIYARYGAFDPVIILNHLGQTERFFQSKSGELTPDTYKIPFELPQNIKWPFPLKYIAEKYKDLPVLNGTYKPLKALKLDSRGNVWQGLFLKSIFKIKQCIVKQGKKDSCSDDQGRDVRDRLQWQAHLHKLLGQKKYIPKYFDLFEIEEDKYFVMEFIEGLSLNEASQAITKNCKAWLSFSKEEKLIVLTYLLNLTDIISDLHSEGLIHRDITPVNFITSEQRGLVLIDLELMFSLVDGLPMPPFGIGTPGFLSPEQALSSTPTFKEDIYGICATIVALLTGLNPIKFRKIRNKELCTSLNFFIADENISNLISAGLQTDPSLRPDMATIISGLQIFKNEIETASKTKFNLPGQTLRKPAALSTLITAGIESITQPPILLIDGLWASKTSQRETNIENPQKGYSLYVGLDNGVAGVLYFFAVAKKAGYSLEKHIETISNGWKFITVNYLPNLPYVLPGLYKGAAGIAVSMALGIRNELLEDHESTRKTILACLSLESPSLDLATGIAGQGIALISCRAYLEKNSFQQQLSRCIQIIIDNQRKDGSWLCLNAESLDPKAVKSLSFNHGVAGIAFFLVQCYPIVSESKIKDSILKAVKWIRTQSNDLKIFYSRTANKPKDTSLIKEGIANLILFFIHSYEILKDPTLQAVAEEALRHYPENIVRNDFTQDGGLAELGEIYLEAYRVFNNEIWLDRASWIVNLLMQTVITSYEKMRFWYQRDQEIPTGEFLSGNSGILHFLIRYQNPEKIGYRLLNQSK